MATFLCPHCKASIKHSVKLAGRAVACPKCKGRFTVPTTDEPGLVAKAVVAKSSPPAEIEKPKQPESPSVSAPSKQSAGATRRPRVSRRLRVTELGEVTIVTFLDRQIRDALIARETANDLFDLIEQDKLTKVVLNFEKVEMLASVWLSNLIKLRKKIIEYDGHLVLAHLHPQVNEAFTVTKLDRLFDIEADVLDAIECFEDD